MEYIKTITRQYVTSRLSVIGISLGFLVMISLGMLLVSYAQADTETVHPDNMAGWTYVQESTGTSTGSFEIGPASPPFGVGSASLIVDENAGLALRNGNFGGTSLSDITQLSYYTYKESGGDNFLPTFQFDVDFDTTDTATTTLTGANYQGRLVFEPFYQGGGATGTTATGTWMNWDMTDGFWWWSRYSDNDNEWPDGDDEFTRSWEDITTAFPNAAIRAENNILLKAGGGWTGGFDGNVDGLIVGINDTDTTFDFEAEAEVVQPSATINDPQPGDVVFGTTTLRATYDDGNAIEEHDVSWAIRSETCAQGTNTVFGNVDGHDDPYEWNGRDFSAIIDTGRTDEGEYCFIFNPHESVGQDDVRATSTFFVGALTLTPQRATSTLGDTHTVTADIGVSVAGFPLIFEITGANDFGSATTTTSSAGHASLVYTPTATGTDHLSVCADENRNEVCDDDENTASAHHIIVGGDDGDENGGDGDDDNGDEPKDRPTTKADCRDGGWRDFDDPSFKNQGQCIAFVVHNRNQDRFDDRKEMLEARFDRIEERLEAQRERLEARMERLQERLDERQARIFDRLDRIFARF